MGHSGFQAVARTLTLEWSAAALDDLDRFAAFLHERYPLLAKVIAAEIMIKTGIISQHPQLGRPISGSPIYREVPLAVAKATYVFRYAYDGDRLVMLRVFHGREQRDA